MLICHCNQIREQEIEEAILELLNEDPFRLIVPVQVYHHLEKKGRCCGCFPAVIDIIIRVTSQYHAKNQIPEADITDLVSRLKIQSLKAAAPLNLSVTRA